MKKWQIEENILYRDSLIFVINKPSGLPVHAGPKGGPNLEDYFDQIKYGLPNPPALGHRLDRDTSGCLILGRHRKALRKIGKLFMQKKIKKKYWAITHGQPPHKRGSIDAPLSKKTSDKRSWWMTVDEKEGAPSKTKYKILAQNEEYSWLELEPLTGRTHQLRVHCAELGCPILGDPVYGKKEDISQLLLHAEFIHIPLYPSRDPIEISAPAPKYFESFLKSFDESVE